MLTRRLLTAGMAGFGLTGASAAGANAADSRFEGRWYGALSLGSTRLRLELVITDDKATLYSVDQGNSAIPASDMQINGDEILLSFAVIKARYQGRLSGEQLKGTFHQGADLPLDFSRTAQTQTVTALTQSALDATLKSTKATAMGAGAAKGDMSQIWLSGQRSIDDKTALSNTDAWHIGSMTKSMTATLVGRLVEAGVVRFDMTVGQILGDRIASMLPAYKDVSFLHLLSHHSGLQANIELVDLSRFSRYDAKDIKAERIELVTLALKQTPVAPMGEKFLYSNNGFIVAGTMLEAVTGQTWENLITQHLFAPLGLPSAGFGAPKGAAIMGHADLPTGVRAFVPPRDLTTDNPQVLGPAGTVHISLPDLLTYLKAHATAREDLLKKETWATLHTAPFGHDYALGWVVRGDGSRWHNGTNTLWYSEMLFNAAAGKVACAAANEAGPVSQAKVGETLLGAQASLV